MTPARLLDAKTSGCISRLFKTKILEDLNPLEGPPFLIEDNTDRKDNSHRLIGCCETSAGDLERLRCEQELTTYQTCWRRVQILRVN
jgi:hypothetical protein